MSDTLYGNQYVLTDEWGDSVYVGHSNLNDSVWLTIKEGKGDALVELTPDMVDQLVKALTTKPDA